MPDVEAARPPRPPRRRPLFALLVERGVFASEDEARRWVMAGQVLVDGRRIDKPGTPVSSEAKLQVRGRRRFAGRGGYKLEAAVDHFGVSPRGRIALDCGASTGGFTDCLLQNGAELVYAVEAGYGQLLGRLRADPRVRNLERTNLGDLTTAALDPLPSLVTLDLSYLSLTKALPQVVPLISPGADVLALLKPLFEVDDPAAGRSGRVTDPDLLVDALRRVLDAAGASGLAPRAATKLALQPRHGVAEFFVHVSNDTTRAPWAFDEDALRRIVSEPGIGPEDEVTE